MPFSKGYNELFKRMDEGKTIAFHCTAGKDRTGISAMLIEMAFDRNLDDIKHEYMLSNDMRLATNLHIKRLMKLAFAPKHAIDACWYALTNHIENLDNSLALILERYGTFKNYLKEHYGVTEERIAKWKEYYIE
jgi:protein-tyrosine phosphatase